MTWLIEQYDITFGHKHVLPWLYTEAEARDKAISHNIHTVEYAFQAREATANEVAQIRSLIAASERHEAEVRHAAIHGWPADNGNGGE